MNAYTVVELFEQRVAAFTGAPYAVAVDSCTAALTLCCDYLKVGEVTLPARTYCSVPMAVIHAGGTVRFEDRAWRGMYQLTPYPVYDAAKRFRRAMFRDMPHDPSSWLYVCVSFHVRKHIPIGRGGMILTDDDKAAAYFRKARRDGRSDSGGVACAEVVGRNCYMQPDHAARGLMLMDVMPADGFEDQAEVYPDLREMPAFRRCA